MYDRILVPTDGSEGTQGAVEHAIDLATTHDAALHTLYVVETNVGVDSSVSGTLDALEESGEPATDDVVEQAQATDVRTVEPAVEQGTPHRVILDYAEDHDVDLIVIGTHGRTGLDRYLLGSVSEKVVRLSPVPVLTVRLPEESGDANS